MINSLFSTLRLYIDPSIEHDDRGLAVGTNKDKGKKPMDADAFLTVRSRAELRRVMGVAGQEGLIVTPRGASSSTGGLTLPGGKDGDFLEAHGKGGLLGVRFAGGEFSVDHVELDFRKGTAWVPPGVSQAAFRELVLRASEGKWTTRGYQTDPTAEVVAALLAGSVDDDGNGIHNNTLAVDLMHGDGTDHRVTLEPTDYFSISAFAREADVGGNALRLFDGRGAAGYLATRAHVLLLSNHPRVRFGVQIPYGSYPEMLEKLARVNHLFARAGQSMRQANARLRYSSAEFMNVATIELVRQMENKKGRAPGEDEGVGFMVYPEFEVLEVNARRLSGDTPALFDLLLEYLDPDELEELGDLVGPFNGEQVQLIDDIRSGLPDARRFDSRQFKATTDPAVDPLNLQLSLQLMRGISRLAGDVSREDPAAGLFIYGHGIRNGLHAGLGTDSEAAFRAHEMAAQDLNQTLIAQELDGERVRTRGEKPFQGGLGKDVGALAWGLTPDHVQERCALYHAMDPDAVLLLSQIERHNGFMAAVLEARAAAAK